MVVVFFQLKTSQINKQSKQTNKQTNKQITAELQILHQSSCRTSKNKLTFAIMFVIETLRYLFSVYVRVSYPYPYS